jgi:DNA-binding response OmpR family regulator
MGSMFTQCVILHVDDDENDSTVFHRVLMSKGFHGTYRRVRRIETAKAYLKGEDCYSDPSLFPLPDLVVTELSVDGEDAVEFIRWIRQCAHYETTPVIAFSDSTNRKLRERSVQAGATCFIEKTPVYTDLVAKVREIMEHCPPSLLSRLPHVSVALHFLWNFVRDTMETWSDLVELPL